jgi:hypothetical protein
MNRMTFSILLLAAAFSLLLFPSVISQNFTTSTTFVTGTLTQTVTFSSGSVMAVFDRTARGTLAIITQVGNCYTSPIGPLLPGSPTAPRFNVTGSAIHVEYSSFQPVTAYFLSAAQLAVWLEGASNCKSSITPQSGPSLTGSFDVNDTSPSHNPYTLLFTSTTPTVVSVSVGPIALGITVTATTFVELISVKTNVVTTSYLVTLEVPFAQTYGGWMVAAILATAFLGLVAYKKVLAPKRKWGRE